MDHAPETLEHAGPLLASFPGVRLVGGDGLPGVSELSSFDCVVAWASVDEVPEEWFAQLALEGLVVVPILSERRVSRFRRAVSGWTRAADVAGTFIPMTTEPVRPWLGP
jgi:protein-L-isoaspartate O-methyltransferase